MTSSSWAPGTKTLPQNWKTHLNDAPRPFNLVSQNLQNLGALSIDRFLAGGQGADTLDISSHGHALPTFPEALPIPSALPPDVTPTPKSNKTDIDASLRMHKVAHLHKTCQRVFGSGKALQFDYVTEGGPMSMFFVYLPVFCSRLFRFTVHPHNHASERVSTILQDRSCLLAED